MDKNKMKKIEIHSIYRTMKSCPFCGAEVDITDSDAVYPTNRIHTLWRAGCIKCSAEVVGDGRDNAIRLWNTRFKGAETK